MFTKPLKMPAFTPIPHYIPAATLISIGGLLFGLETGTIGPITSMPQFKSTFGNLSPTVHGLIVSTILISASISSFFAGHLANKLGRPRAVAVGAAVFAIGAALESATVVLGMLVFGRAVKGVGEGLFLSTVVVYVAFRFP